VNGHKDERTHSEYLMMSKKFGRNKSRKVYSSRCLLGTVSVFIHKTGGGVARSISFVINEIMDMIITISSCISFNDSPLERAFREDLEFA
jgi:hypothetical protein